MFGKKNKYAVLEDQEGLRVDLLLAKMEAGVSRQYFQKLLDEGRVLLGKKVLKASYKVKTGDLVVVDFPENIKMELKAVAIPLKIVYEDGDLLVVDKQPGLVVHPAEHGRHIDNSLVNAVLAHCGESLKGIGGVLRPGIVHRLDKDTSGLIVIAKNEQAQQGLMKIFKDRKVEKRYMALLVGKFPHEKGRIEAAIGRDMVDRMKMSINGIKARAAVTEFKVEKRFTNKLGSFTLVDIGLLTGRTHQIRVHFQSLGYPLAGDKTYGREKINRDLADSCGLNRQFLHAYKMSFIHPVSQKKLDLIIDLAPDLQKCLEKLSA